MAKKTTSKRNAEKEKVINDMKDERRIAVVGSIPYSVTWVDGAIIFKSNKKLTRLLYGYVSSTV
jgi:hypothetical protein